MPVPRQLSCSVFYFTEQKGTAYQLRKKLFFKIICLFVVPPQHILLFLKPVYVFLGVFAAAVVSGYCSETDSERHCGKGDIWCFQGRHHAAPPVGDITGQHADGHDQCHLCWRAHEESTGQVTNTHLMLTDCSFINPPTDGSSPKHKQIIGFDPVLIFVKQIK